MLISDISVKRPVFATVVNLLLVVFGIVAFFSLPLREYPDIDPPIVSISTQYPGASAEIVESKITRIIEDRISGIDGIKNINSSSRDGGSNISIEFSIDRDIEAAANDVRERVSRTLNNLPQEVNPPEVTKADSDEDVIAWFVLNSVNMNTLELSDYANRYIVERFAVVDGVARIRLGGEREYAMKVWLDRAAMAARGVTVQDIENALRQENVELPAGDIESVERDFSVRVARSYKSQQDFQHLVLKRGDNGYLVRLGDVAKVELTAKDEKNLFRGNGKNMVGIGIIKQAKANTLEVVDNARAELERIKATLPEGTTIEPSYDSSIFIRESIKEVYNTLYIAIGLVVLVIYLFLGNIRATIIPAVTVPVSLIATSIVMLALGYSINLLTLLAMVLAIGLVVDDAIVVLENIYRRIEHGEPPLLAAFNGAREVGFAVIATTLVLISVFVPLVFMQGQIGSLFTEFAIAIAAAVGFSSVTALTLSPMLCSKILSKQERNSRFGQLLDRAFAKLEQGYRQSLVSTIPKAGTAVIGFLLCLGLCYTLYQQIPSELSPREDRANFFVMMRTAEGASFESNRANMEQIENILMPYYQSGELTRMIVRVPGFGGSGGIAIVGSDDWEHRQRDTWSLMAEVTGKLNGVTDVQAFPMMRSGLGGRGLGLPVQFVIQGNTYEELVYWRDRIMAKARENPNLLRLDHDFKETVPQLSIKIDKDRAADLGVSVQTIGRTLESMLGQRRVTTFMERGEEYDVLLEGIKADYTSPSDISQIYVRSQNGQLVPLDSLIKIDERATSSSLNRYNRMRAITISADLAQGYTLAQALTFLNNVVAQEADGEISVDYKGQSQLYYEGDKAIVGVFILALVITYLVLAAQFESFIHPLIIMLTVPLGITGALLGLYYSGMTINIYSQIGIVMLIGLSAKNGILIVEFANQMRDAGKPFNQALEDAAVQRLRPIVMTAFTTVMSAIPLILATGPGSESRMVIGMVIFAGVAFATLLTLYFVPICYQALAKNTRSPEQLSKQLQQMQHHQS